MAVTTTKTNKPLNPRGNDQSPKGYNRAELYTGKALDFDGVNDYVDLDGFTMAGNVATICFYAQFDNDGYLLDLNPNRLVIKNHNTQGFQVYNNNAWTVYDTTDMTTMGFYVIVSDGTTQRAYYNGHQLSGDKTITAIDFSAITEFKLGSYHQTGSPWYNGKIAGFKIFNTALTPAQVSDLYNNPEKIVPTGVEDTALKLWLPMMEGAGTTAYDGSGNGNHGTISGATYVNGVGAPVAQSAVIDWNKLYDFDGVNDVAVSSTYVDTTGTKTYKIHFNSHDVTQADQQIFQFWNTSTLLGMGGTINFLGTNSGVLGIRGYGSGTSFDNTSWSGLTNNTFYELEFTIDWDAESITSATLNGVASDGSVSARLDTANNGLCLGARVSAYYLKGIINYFEVVGEEKWTNASGFKSESGSYDMTISGSPTQILAPQGLTTGRDITGVNLFENVRKQGALNLDGNSWAEVHDNASVDVSDAITLEAWVYWDGTANNDGVLGRWFSGATSYMIYAHAGQLLFYTNTSSSAASISGTGWKHVIGTYDLVSRRIYIDGQEIGSGTAYNSPLATSDKPIEIGKYGGSGAAASYQNQIAQPRIYNRALTAEEVERNYTAGKYIYTND
jgi:hypothetical protein